MKRNRLYAAETNRGLTAFTAEEMRLIDRATSNVVAYYESAPESVKAEGASWYSGKAAELACSILDVCPELSMDQIAAVIAVCSPRTRWAQQVNNTAAFLRHILDGGSVYSAPKCSLYYNAMEKAALVALYEDWSAVRGDKVRAFFENIRGNEGVVTLDVWAIRAALGRDDMPEAEVDHWTRGRGRLVLEAAYHRAAAEQNETPAALQAVVWVQVRGKAD